MTRYIRTLDQLCVICAFLLHMIMSVKSNWYIYQCALPHLSIPDIFADHTKGPGTSEPGFRNISIFSVVDACIKGVKCFRFRVHGRFRERLKDYITRRSGEGGKKGEKGRRGQGRRKVDKEWERRERDKRGSSHQYLLEWHWPQEVRPLKGWWSHK